MCLKTGRLPPEAPKTFANLDFDRLRGADRAATGRPPAMANPCARRSLASVGPEGVGKTHLARAHRRNLETFWLCFPREHTIIPWLRTITGWGDRLL